VPAAEYRERILGLKPMPTEQTRQPTPPPDPIPDPPPVEQPPRPEPEIDPYASIPRDPRDDANLYDGKHVIHLSGYPLVPVAEDEPVLPDLDPSATEPDAEKAMQAEASSSGENNESPVIETVPAPQPYRILGEAFHSYVLVEREDRLLLIDKHAAHERLIFERLKALMRRTDRDSQLLLLPVDVLLDRADLHILSEYRSELEAIGFVFEEGEHSLQVSAIPGGIEVSAVPDMFAEFAARLREQTGTINLTRDLLFEKALYSASCKAAIKAGRDYPTEHIRELVAQLMQLPDITFCPHGRPIAMELTKTALDHQFKRS
jgi:DNA mismatch repair protein MutL